MCHRVFILPVQVWNVVKDFKFVSRYTCEGHGIKLAISGVKLRTSPVSKGSIAGLLADLRPQAALIIRRATHERRRCICLQMRFSTRLFAWRPPSGSVGGRRRFVPSTDREADPVVRGVVRH